MRIWNENLPDNLSRLTYYLRCLALVFLCTIGCQKERNLSTGEQDNSAKVEGQLGALYQVYLKGDVESARRSVQQAIELIESSSSEIFDLRASYLWIYYARLHTLETKEGNDLLAEKYLVKTKYWHLVTCETLGMSLSESMEAVGNLTSQKCIEIVDEMDRKNVEQEQLLRYMMDEEADHTFSTNVNTTTDNERPAPELEGNIAE